MMLNLVDGPMRMDFNGGKVVCCHLLGSCNTVMCAMLWKFFHVLSLRIPS
jgi:hypothetical protein